MKTSFIILAIFLAFNFTSHAQRDTGSDRTGGSTDRTERTSGSGTINRNPEQTREQIKSSEKEKTTPTVVKQEPKTPTNPSPKPYHDLLVNNIPCPIYTPEPTIIVVSEPSLDDLSLQEIYELGIERLNYEDYQEALECFNILIEEDPFDYEAYCLRGRTYHELEMFERAIKDYQISIKIDSTYAKSYYYLGLTQLQLGNKEEAIDNFEQAAALGYEQAAYILKKYFK